MLKVSHNLKKEDGHIPQIMYVRSGTQAKRGRALLCLNRGFTFKSSSSTSIHTTHFFDGFE